MGWVAFLPWLRLTAPVKVGRYDLLPYDAKGSFADAGSIEIVRSLLAPYCQRFDLAGRFSTVVRRDGKIVCDDNISDEELNELFRFSEYLAFAGLAERRYFDHVDYWNRDHFRLIVQKFAGTDGGTVLLTRRRDGSTNNLVPAEYFKVVRPTHVGDARVTIDSRFLQALLSEPLDADRPGLHDAIVTFNMANTDADYVRDNVEVMLAANAFQRALDCKGTKDVELAKNLAKSFTPSNPVPLLSGRLATQKNQIPASSTVREVWVRDLYRLRNDLGHGKVTPIYRSIWTVREHLLLAAFAFPLLVKSIFSSVGAYTLADRDIASIEAFERLAIAPDLMAWSPGGECTWSRILFEAGDEVANKRISEIASRLRDAPESEGPNQVPDTRRTT
jgi:hypothetical protein